MKQQITVFLILVFHCFVLFSQDISWEHTILDVTDGLTNNGVRCILQDKEGFMWFGTERGLNRYDGYEFKVHTMVKNDTTKLFTDWINDICEDEKGLLWIATLEGLHKFDKKTGIFTRYIHNPDDTINLFPNNVIAVKSDKEGEIWLGTLYRGLVKFDKNEGVFKTYMHDEKDTTSISNNLAPVIYNDKSDAVWVSSALTNIDKFNRVNETFSRYSGARKGLLMDTCFASNYFEDSENRLLISGNCGVFEYKRETNEFIEYLNKNDIPGRLDTNIITSLITDSRKNIWVRTFGGICQFNPELELIYYLRLNPVNIDMLSYYRTKSICESKDGVIWFNSPNGVHKLVKKVNRFYTLKHDPQNANSLTHSTVEAICIDDDENLWAGTNFGLNKIDRENNKITRFFHNPEDSTTINTWGITSLFNDHTGTVWVGTHNGLCKYIKDGKEGFIRYIHNPKDSGSISSSWVQKIYQDHTNKLWIGYFTSLPDYYDQEKDRFIHLINNPNETEEMEVSTGIYHEEETGELWAAGWAGAYIVHPPFEQLSPYLIRAGKITAFRQMQGKANSLNNEHIIYFHQDKKGVVWLGTSGGGLNKLERRKDKKGEFTTRITHYTRKDGLSSNVIHSILEDDNGNLWMGTDNGLSKFNPDNETFTSYHQKDGLPTNNFYWRAAYKDKTGEMFFGTEEGLVSFYPDSIPFNQVIPPIVLTDVKIFNESVQHIEDLFLEEAITSADEIKLSYNQNYLSFEFSALNYYSTEDNKYKYKLEGFNKEWVNAGTKHTADYPNLKHGEYVFRVIGSNSDGLWNEEGAGIKVIIRPPWWHTKAAYVLYFIILISGLYVFIEIRERKLKRDKKLLEEKIIRRTQKIEAQNNKITDSIHYAQRIQNALFPPHKIINNLLPDYFILYKPRDIVSGDYYWIGEKENKIVVAVADCTGHGVPGAFMSMLGIAFLNEIVNKTIKLRADEILNQLRRQVIRSLHQTGKEDETRDGMEIALCIIDLNKMKVQYAGAFSPLYLIRNHEFIEFKADKMPIGIYYDEEQSFTCHEVQLIHNDSIYLFSDGYKDQIGGPRKKSFKSKYFRDLLLNIHEKNMEDQKNILEMTIENWRGEIEQIDDILVMGIKV